jgi:hypothetical protein
MAFALKLPIYTWIPGTWYAHQKWPHTARSGGAEAVLYARVKNGEHMALYIIAQGERMSGSAAEKRLMLGTVHYYTPSCLRVHGGLQCNTGTWIYGERPGPCLEYVYISICMQRDVFTDF